MSKQRHTITGKAVPIYGNDIDTDRIIPARFLKEITFDKMGDYLFQDVRFSHDHTPKEHSLNDLRFLDASIMVVNRNFGCGSSREHAPQSIKRAGFNAIVGESFAEIFQGNCKELGIPTVIASFDHIKQLQNHIETSPKTVLSIDLTTQQLTADTLTIPITLPEANRQAFIEGTWDVLNLLKQNKQLIQKTAKCLGYA